MYRGIRLAIIVFQALIMRLMEHYTNIQDEASNTDDWTIQTAIA